ncbi:MAG TPA: RNA polymerase sigma-70 factor [Candidatus Binatia bacterium]|jgi:RNA polymerase sigma-70 factor (ECF subfamily)|nr:RNA polymerase sigma-70 factor [Candidatus Binatia bacterium]
MSSKATVPPDDPAATYASLRPRLFGIAYRMLGSVADAEDVLQDAWLRWQATNHAEVLDAAAFLVTITTRLALNVVQSARARRETYVGQWLPEPVDTAADPALGAERGEALEVAVLLLEKLPPAERAAYVLSQAFDYSHAQIAEILSVSEVNARQLASRARKHLADERCEPVPVAEQRRLLGAFLTAARANDLEALKSLFASDVVSYSDGGGAVRAAGKPIVGADRVADFFVAVGSWFWADAAVEPVEVNGQGAFLVEHMGAPYGVLTIGASRDGIDRIFWVMNPAKLASVLAGRATGAVR